MVVSGRHGAQRRRARARHVQQRAARARALARRARPARARAQLPERVVARRVYLSVVHNLIIRASRTTGSLCPCP